MKSTYTPFNAEKIKESSGFLLWQVTNLWQREFKKSLELYGLTHSQFVLLASINWHAIQKQEVTQIVLSNHTKIDPKTTSTILRTLQKKDSIRRQEHLTDTRAKTVELTEDGKKLIKKAIVTVEKFDTNFLLTLGNKRKDFNSCLLTLIEQK